MSTAFPENAFWDWSLAAYARPGVAPACLTLQERHGLDVNILLFCCWTATRGQYLDRESLKRAVADVADWHHEAVRPLRAVRQRLKREMPAVPPDLVEAVRRQVAEAELAAEHLEQIVLSRHASAEAAGDPEKAAEAIAANLALYAAVSPFAWVSEDAGPLEGIIREVAPDCPPATVAALAAAIPVASAV